MGMNTTAYHGSLFNYIIIMIFGVQSNSREKQGPVSRKGAKHAKYRKGINVTKPFLAALASWRENSIRGLSRDSRAASGGLKATHLLLSSSLSLK
jgi:hypothetical protein